MMLDDYRLVYLVQSPTKGVLVWVKGDAQITLRVELLHGGGWQVFLRWTAPGVDVMVHDTRRHLHRTNAATRLVFLVYETAGLVHTVTATG